MPVHHIPPAIYNDVGVKVAAKPWITQSTSKPYSATTIPGGYRFEIRRGDQWHEDPPDGRQRSELRGQQGFAYGAMLTADFYSKLEAGPVSDRYFIIPFQIHTDDSMKVSPVLSLNLLPNKAHTAEELHVDLNNGTKAHESHRTFVVVSPFRRGVYHHFTVKFIDSHGQEQGGYAQVSMDGKKLLDFKGNTGFQEAVQLDYPKFGIYAGPATQPGDTGIISYIRDLRMTVSDPTVAGGKPGH